MQSNPFAQRNFSKQVEEKMLVLGFKKEAHFCRLVRSWYDAEDKRAISAADRMEARIELYEFLLEQVDVTRFPLDGEYMGGEGGMTKKLFEGLLQSIEAHFFLYAIVRGGTYAHAWLQLCCCATNLSMAS